MYVLVGGSLVVDNLLTVCQCHRAWGCLLHDGDRRHNGLRCLWTQFLFGLFNSFSALLQMHYGNSTQWRCKEDKMTCCELDLNPQCCEHMYANTGLHCILAHWMTGMLLNVILFFHIGLCPSYLAIIDQYKFLEESERWGGCGEYLTEKNCAGRGVYYKAKIMVLAG